MRDVGDPMKTAQFLQEQPLFGGVDDDAMEAIVPLLQEVTFAAGEVIVREGDDGDAMFLICTGAVEVLKACLLYTSRCV